MTRVSILDHEQTVVADGRSVCLTRKQFELFKALLAGNGAAVSMETLQQAMSWKPGSYTMPHTVVTFISRVRKALPEVPIQAVTGVGYRMIGVEVVA